ncbi:MAG TPA: TonB-dependent receptor [Candidatus Acidoferrum sp.]|nr:TonB-dependent receptor [Candidatus Acidoferrum sp.]
MKSWSAIWLVVIAFVCFAPSVLAQSGSFAGSVTDSSAAEVPNAKITALNVATGISRTAETDESGTYRITNLNPGIYDVRIEHAGFKSILFSHIPLSVDEVLTLDAHLVVSAAKETVTVTSEAVARVNINDAQVGNLVDSRQMTDLPLILRDPYALILLSPGVIQSNTLFGGFSVNGSRERSNNFLLDGTDNNDPDFGGFPRGLSVLNPETTQEFRVINNSYLPEFGRNSGAIIDIVTKHGTNDFHADAYWFGRYTALSAKDYFAADRSQDPFVRNQFGFSLGGPIQKNRTFFFVNGELQRFSTTILNTSIVPTQDFKSGAFNYTYTVPGQPPITIPIDVTTPGSAFYGTGNNATPLSPDPTMKQILALYPAPNGQILDGARGILHFPSHSLSNGNSVTGRIDHDFRGGGILALHYTYNEYSDNNYRHQDFLPGLGGVSTDQHNDNISLGLTSNFRQTMTNELRLGFNRLEFPLTCTGVNHFNALSPGGLDAVGNGMDFPLPASLSGFGCILLGDSSGSTRDSGTFTAGDSFSWVLSRHTIKIGGEFHDVYSNSSNNYASRTMMDFSLFSNFNLPAAVTGTAADQDPTLQNLVWMLLGGVDLQTQAQFFNSSQTRTSTDARQFRQHEVAGFGQDSYKLFSNVTFTYGFRYEFFGVPTEVDNLLSTLTVPPDGPAPFTFVQVGEGSGRAPLYQNDWKDIEPRVAAAWDPFRNGKSSVRAGYGIYHDRIFGQLISMLRGDPPYQMLETLPCGGLLAYLGSLESAMPAPQDLQQCALSAQSPLSKFQSSPVVSNYQVGQPGSPILPFLVDPNLRTPYTQTWNLGIQHEFYPTLLFEVNYVGSKGTHLLRLVDGNPPQPALVSALEAFCVPTNPENLMNCGPQTLQFSNLWLGGNNGSLPPNFPNGAANNSAFLQAELYKSIASSTYQALQMNITKRFSHGFAIQAAYTYSHAIDNASDPLVPGQGNQSFPRDSLDLGPERGNSDFDVRHRLVMNYSWQLPFGRGAKHWSEGIAGKMLEGWDVSGISTFSSGLPYDIFTNLDTQHTGFASRPDYNPSATVTPSSNPRTQTGPLVGYFSDPAFGSAGNIGRNVFRGPGINNTDFVITKRISVSERTRLDLRFEFYNLFNRVQFNQPDNSIADGPGFGQSTSEYVRPDFTTGARQIQLALKLTF